MKKIVWICILACLLVGCATLPAQEGTPIVVTQEPQNVVTPVLREDEEGLARGEIYLEKMQIVSVDADTGLVMLHLEGQLPTPCHQLGVSVCPECDENRPQAILVEVYSLIEAGRVCRGPTTPFEQDVPISGLAAGVYELVVNGEMLEELTMP